MITKDYYKILEISPTATPEAIKQAYRKLAFKYHPDKTFGDTLAEHKFKDIVEAYETLSDKHKKINYDYDYQKQTDNGTKTFTPPPPPQSNGTTEHRVQSVLKTFIEVRRSVEGIDSRGKKIKQQALYNRLYELLSQNNIAMLHSYGNAKVNQQIVNNVLKCCQFLAYPYVQDLSPRLARVAGADNATIEKIYQFTRQKKRWSFWEQHRQNLTIIAITLVFIGMLLFLISL
jgi:molecular chaperone DnaJ